MKGLAGVSARGTHQYLITCFVVEINQRIEKFKRYKNYAVVPEYDLKSRQNPDVSIYVYKKGVSEPIVVIEICSQKTLKKDLIKIQTMIDQNPSIAEAYVLDFETFDFYQSTRVNKTPVLVDKITAVSLPIKNVIERYQKSLLIFSA